MIKNPPSYRRFLLPLALALLATAAFYVDLPIAKAARDLSSMPRWGGWLTTLDLFEGFGHGIGALFILFIVYMLDPNHRWAIPRILACGVAGGGTADLLKLLISRTRPYEFDFQGSVWTTFGQWLPCFSAGSGGQSFPSAHTATAAGIAAALIWLYPQGRSLFVTLTILVGCQRVASSAHYPSDVLFGAAASCFVTLFLLHVGRLAKWIDRREQVWRTEAKDTNPRPSATLRPE